MTMSETTEQRLARIFDRPLPDHLRRQVDEQVMALWVETTGPASRRRWGPLRRATLLALAATLALAAFLAGVAVGRYVDPNEPVGVPGLENPGEPFYGVGLNCMTPPEANAVIVAKGFAVSWQIEDRDSEGNGSTSFSTTPPPAGVVEGGFIQRKTAYVVVSVGSGAIPFDWCK